MKILFIRSFIVYVAVFGLVAVFEFGGASNAASVEQAEVDNAERVEKALKTLFGEAPIDIERYNDHLLEVRAPDDVYFVSNDGQYLFAGPVIDIATQTDLRAERLSSLRKHILSQEQEGLYVSYPSVGTEKYKVYVFTDIDCPYCRRFHNWMNELNQMGVTVNYVMLPRGGPGSTAYKQTQTAFCAKDPSAAITIAMQRKEADDSGCETLSVTQQQDIRLKQHIDLAQRLKVGSTPTIVFPDGSLRVGAIGPDELLNALSMTDRDPS